MNTMGRRINLVATSCEPVIWVMLTFGVVMLFMGASQFFGQIYIIANGGPVFSTLRDSVRVSAGIGNYELGYVPGVLGPPLSEANMYDDIN